MRRSPGLFQLVRVIWLSWRERERESALGSGATAEASLKLAAWHVHKTLNRYALLPA